MCSFYSTVLCHFIVCFSLYRTVKLHLYVCRYYGLRLSNFIKETTYLLTYLLTYLQYTQCSYISVMHSLHFESVAPLLITHDSQQQVSGTGPYVRQALRTKITHKDSSYVGLQTGAGMFPIPSVPKTYKSQLWQRDRATCRQF